MKRILIGILSLGALLLATMALPPAATEATHPATPRPILECADVNGDGPVAVGDIGVVVAKFGLNSASGTPIVGGYHPLYDLSPSSGSGFISIGDIGAAVGDFGQNCALGPDTEIAQATLALLNSPDWSSYLNENASFLATKGYFIASTDVPGQGVHYVHYTYFDDDRFNPVQPDGLVYNNGKLVAQLYFVDGDMIGWGSEPPPEDQVNIDAFCTPTPPDTKCSWTGAHDGWHVHFDLCTVAIGHPAAAAIPGVASASTCESIHNSWCGGKCPGSTWRWAARVGWMGHLWNHLIDGNVNAADVNGNGRFTDCFPEPNGGTPPNDHWNGYNCPQ